MSVPRTIRTVVAFLLVLLSFSPLAAQAQEASPIIESVQEATPVPGSFEVWVIDQSDTTPEGGGTLYVFPGAGLTDGAGDPEVIDLGSDAASL